MILCDFEDLNNEEFHLKFFDNVVQGNIELIKEVLSDSKLSTQFDVSYKNHYCIIASIFNSQQVNDCHLELLKLFTQSPLLKKHANPTLCPKDDIFAGALGNAIIFTPIETVRFIAKFFNDISNLEDLFNLSIFNSRKEAFFYLVKERQFTIPNVEKIIKTLPQFPDIDEEIKRYIHSLKATSINDNNNTDKKTVTLENKKRDIRPGRKYKLHSEPSSFNNLSFDEQDKYLKSISYDEFHKTSNSKSNTLKEILEEKKIDIRTGRKFVLNVSNMKQTNISNHYWGSKFKRNF